MVSSFRFFSAGVDLPSYVRRMKPRIAGWHSDTELVPGAFEAAQEPGLQQVPVLT